MSVSRIKNAAVRRTVLVAIWPVWAALVVLASALSGAFGVLDDITKATGDAWRGPRA